MDYQKALEVLELNEGYLEEDLKKNHRKLVKKHHPDISNDNGVKFQEITEAYNYLKEYKPDSRVIFNRQGVVYHGETLFDIVIK